MDKCAGEKRQYKSCQSSTCPADALPFRNMQCAVYNYKPVLGSQLGYRWVPFYEAPDTCHLNCMAVGHKFYYTFGRVLDGTRCGLDSGGTCINGLCMKAGCDGIFGINVPGEPCGKCQGTKDSCVFIQSVFLAPFPSSGYFSFKNVTRIPSGATWIKVTDESRNILALMDSKNNYVINGDWVVSWPGTYKVAGTEVHYNRSAESHEFLEAAGPTDEDLYVQVLFQEHNPGIKYEFWLPKDIYYNYKEVSQLSWQQSEQEDLHIWLNANTSNTLKPSYGTSQGKKVHCFLSGAGCRKCKTPKGKSQRIKQYCQSDFVIHAKVLKKTLFGHLETRYDIQVKHAYKRKFPIMNHEYIWVSNTCDCPQLLDLQEYVMMASRHANHKYMLSSTRLSSTSFVKPWTPEEELKLQSAKTFCSISP
ncbi:hypothetical protein GDO86_000985 [Hymenochirus boettgeri]|uniref:NTR domain-containing protein n=1 Tax=Hymenochirus boettgeri TaxID=247094 RepID=A0A8T2KFC1_9PIPI|nr:hypothetical protein GDO86_000985 [Hymenochirus boettgeri]